MNHYRKHLLALASLSLGTVAAAQAGAASLTEVSRSTWAGSATLPSYVKMYIYVPDKVATSPAIMVSSHSCGSTASGQMGNIKKIQAAADKYGFILILPDNPGQNCWDVGASSSLKHDGGGDTHAVAQMVRYTLTKYNGDPKRVYAMGGSSGAMMTQALMAVYPDLFTAGSARAGVPAGCWADTYKAADQWSDTCAGGNVNKTAQQWGDLVRGMYTGYSGHRPRVQLFHGDADGTINYRNMTEAVEEWTNVLGLETTPTSKDTTKTSIASYNREFWANTCGYIVLEAWTAPGGSHSMSYEEDAILKFFGLDTATTADPEYAACPEGGGGSGAGGASGSTGGSPSSSGVAGRASTTPAGIAGRNSGGAGRPSGQGGSSGGPNASPKGGSAPGSGGAVASGGSANNGKGGSKASPAANSGGANASGGEASNAAKGGSGASATTNVSAQNTGGAATNNTVTAAKGGSGVDGAGGSQSSSQSSAKGGEAKTEDAKFTPPADPGGGCSLGVDRDPSRSVPAGMALLLALGLVSRRRRSRA